MGLIGHHPKLEERAPDRPGVFLRQSCCKPPGDCRLGSDRVSSETWDRRYVQVNSQTVDVLEIAFWIVSGRLHTSCRWPMSPGEDRRRPVGLSSLIAKSPLRAKSDLSESPVLD